MPEDVVRYGAADLAMLAERAWDFLANARPGHARRSAARRWRSTHSGERKSVTVIEIVNDDMPFLVDSVMGEIAERRLDVRLVAHPVFGVARDSAGKLTALGAPDAGGSARESFIHIHLAPIEAEACARASCRRLPSCSREVRSAVTGLAAMLERVNAIVAELKTNPPPLPVDEIAEAIQFLQWLLADNFTFLGLRDYAFDGHALVPDYRRRARHHARRANSRCCGAATSCWNTRRKSWRS